MNTEKELEKEVARLESVIDYLETERESLDEVLREVGFSHGIETVKATAFELIEMESDFNGEHAA